MLNCSCSFYNTDIFSIIYMTLIWVKSLLSCEHRPWERFLLHIFLTRLEEGKETSPDEVSVASRWHWANDTEQTRLPQCIICPQISILHLTSHGWLPIESSSSSFRPFVMSRSSAGVHAHTNRYTVLTPQAAQFKSAFTDNRVVWVSDVHWNKLRAGSPFQNQKNQLKCEEWFKPCLL